jgi:hypothetical protein
VVVSAGEVPVLVADGVEGAVVEKGLLKPDVTDPVSRKKGFE